MLAVLQTKKTLVNSTIMTVMSRLRALSELARIVTGLLSSRIWTVMAMTARIAGMTVVRVVQPTASSHRIFVKLEEVES